MIKRLRRSTFYLVGKQLEVPEGAQDDDVAENITLDEKALFIRPDENEEERKHCGRQKDTHHPVHLETAQDTQK